MVLGESDNHSNASADGAALAVLRAGAPQLRIDREIWGHIPMWVARGDHGHPWLLASDDLERFRRALGRQAAG